VDGDDLSTHRIALVVNPASGLGRAGGLADAVRQRLGERAEVAVFAGTSADESQQLLHSVARGYEAVAVLGGDGVVHQALQALAGGQTPLGIIPAGTGNDIADTLGLPADPYAAADAVLTALDASSVQSVDLGRTDSGRWWATILCAGFDSAVNERANRMRWPRGPRRYDLAIVAEMARLRARPFTVCLDGGDEESTLATLVAVGNAPQYGGGKLMTPHGRMDDGRFAVTVVGPVNRRTLARIAPTLARAGHIGHPAVSTHEACVVTLNAPDTIAYADGERLGPLPVTTTCVPQAIGVLVPPGVAGRGMGG
jgi:diacylglycerol kinase (ATP)